MNDPKSQLVKWGQKSKSQDEVSGRLWREKESIGNEVVEDIEAESLRRMSLELG